MSEDFSQDIAVIQPDDVVRIVQLLGRVAGMTEPLQERRRALVTGLADLIDADVWVWILSRGLEDARIGPLWTLDGGFRDDAERTRVWHINSQPEFARVIGGQLDFTVHASTPLIVDALPPGDREKMQDWLRQTDLEHLMFMLYPLGDGSISGIGIHRRTGRPAYGSRERAILQLVTGHIDWLHRAGTDVAANTPQLAQLSPRLSETLLYVLTGESRKQIAKRMNLSEHTVADYLKALHKHFGVNSRSELLAKFIG